MSIKVLCFNKHRGKAELLVLYRCYLKYTGPVGLSCGGHVDLRNEHDAQFRSSVRLKSRDEIQEYTKAFQGTKSFMYLTLCHFVICI